MTIEDDDDPRLTVKEKKWEPMAEEVNSSEFSSEKTEKGKGPRLSKSGKKLGRPPIKKIEDEKDKKAEEGPEDFSDVTPDWALP